MLKSVVIQECRLVTDTDKHTHEETSAASVGASELQYKTLLDGSHVCAAL